MGASRLSVILGGGTEEREREMSGGVSGGVSG
jgi:hypothetical protein